MGLYDTFDYTGGFVAYNISSILSMVGCLKALTNAPGKVLMYVCVGMHVDIAPD